MKNLNFCDRRASAIALGTMNFGGGVDEAAAFEIMDGYVRIGGNHFDTARMYTGGESERIVGRWMRARGNRNEVLLATKGGFPNGGRPRLSRDEILSDMEKSLEALDTDCVDLYYLHRDDPARDVREIADILNELLTRGFTRHIGVSNWRADRIRALTPHLTAPLAASQIEFSLARQVVVEDETLVQMDAESERFHRESGLPCVCFSSQAKGFMQKLSALGPDGLSDKARRRYYFPENMARCERAARLARELNTTVGAIALAYLICQPFACVPIAGISRVSHLDDIARASEIALTDAQLAYLRG